MTLTAIIAWAAKSVGVPGTLFLAICSHESNLNNIIVTSDGGSPSIGVCQLKEDTARMLGYKGTADGLMNPRTNALWAAKYLKYQLDRYDNNWCKAAAAYNAGTFNESTKSPGQPRNFKYIRCVQNKLDVSLHYRLLSCQKESQ